MSCGSAFIAISMSPKRGAIVWRPSSRHGPSTVYDRSRGGRLRPLVRHHLVQPGTGRRRARAPPDLMGGQPPIGTIGPVLLYEIRCHRGPVKTDPGLRHVSIHGHSVAYRRAGQGEAVVLIHGLAGNSRTWKDIMPALARTHDVIAPDLLGHGESAKPMGDYSLGAPRQWAAGPPRDARRAERDDRRALLRRRRGDAAQLPAPGAVRPSGPDRQRRSRTGGDLAAAHADPAVGRAADAGRLPLLVRRQGNGRQQVPSTAGASTRLASARCGGRTARWPARRTARRSCAPSARSSIRGARR